MKVPFCRWTTWVGVIGCLVVWLIIMKALFWSAPRNLPSSEVLIEEMDISPKFKNPPNTETVTEDELEEDLPILDPVRTSKACVQNERLYAISQYCKAHPEYSNFTMDPRSELDPYRKFVVDRKHELLLCQVPKAAGSFWRTMLVRGTGEVSMDEEDTINIHRQDDLHSVGLDFLHVFSEEEQKRMLSEYLKVMTVRHPLERALSAYIDKFVTMKQIRDPIMDCIKFINKYHRSKKNQIKLPKGKYTIPSGVTIKDFVNLVLDERSPYNAHWDSAFQLCHPCVIQYDHIIRTETIADDADKILQLLSSELEEPLQLEVVHSRRNQTVEDLKNIQLYSKVLEDYKHIPKEDLERLMEKYKTDLDVFGYNFHVPSHEALCAYDKHVEEHCC